MAWSWHTIGTTVDTSNRGFTFNSYASTSTTSATSTRSQYSGYNEYTGGTGDEYINPRYYTPIRFERQGPISQEQPRTPPPPPKPSPEEINAQKLARELLLEHLTENQKKQYTDNKPIEVISKLFNDIRYLIPISNKLDKICALKGENVVSKLCLVVKEPEKIPLDDVILTKLLHVLHNEEEVLRIANHSSIVENLLARLN